MEQEDDESLPLGEDFEALTISLARSGDVDAGKEALKMCRAGLCSNSLSEPLRFYLAECLADLIGDVKANRAMNIEVQPERGRPANPLPKWETPLAAFGALLHKRGYIAARIEEAMSHARQTVAGKDLDARDARRIRKKYKAMEVRDELDLVELCGDQGIRGEIAKYPPVT